eukprot:tig00021094_g18097.t1
MQNAFVFPASAAVRTGRARPCSVAALHVLPAEVPPAASSSSSSSSGPLAQRSFLGARVFASSRPLRRFHRSVVAQPPKAVYQLPPDESDGGEDREDRPLTASGPNLLFEQVRTMQPSDLKQLIATLSPEAADAMKKTILSMVGTLPSEHFVFQVSTNKENLKRLLFSAMMTGFSFRNAEIRVSLNKSLSPEQHPDLLTGAAPEDALASAHPEALAPVSPSIRSLGGRSWAGNVSGQVRLEGEEGMMEAAEYIDRLRAELAAATAERDRLKVKLADANPLIDHLLHADPESVARARNEASEEALEAMERVLAEQLGSMSGPQIQTTATTTRDYLAHLTFWAMLVGYHLKGLENRAELTRMLSSADNEQQ